MRHCSRVRLWLLVASCISLYVYSGWVQSPVTPPRVLLVGQHSERAPERLAQALLAEGRRPQRPASVGNETLENVVRGTNGTESANGASSTPAGAGGRGSAHAGWTGDHSSRSGLRDMGGGGANGTSPTPAAAAGSMSGVGSSSSGSSGGEPPNATAASAPVGDGTTADGLHQEPLSCTAAHWSGQPNACTAALPQGGAAYVFVVHGAPSLGRLSQLGATVRLFRAHHPTETVLVLITCDTIPQQHVSFAQRVLGPHAFIVLGHTVRSRRCDLAQTKVQEDSAHRGKVYYGSAYTKLLLWNWTRFDALLFLDFDLAVLGSLNAALDNFIAAGHEYGGSLTGNYHCQESYAVPHTNKVQINTGVMLVRPSSWQFRDIMVGKETGEYDCDIGVDQEMINKFFFYRFKRPWFSCLPPRYNCRTFDINACRKDVRVVHWSGETKPWDPTYTVAADEDPVLVGALRTWRAAYSNFSDATCLSPVVPLDAMFRTEAVAFATLLHGSPDDTARLSAAKIWITQWAHQDADSVIMLLQGEVDAWTSALRKAGLLHPVYRVRIMPVAPLVPRACGNASLDVMAGFTQFQILDYGRSYKRIVLSQASVLLRQANAPEWAADYLASPAWELAAMQEANTVCENSGITKSPVDTGIMVFRPHENMYERIRSASLMAGCSTGAPGTVLNGVFSKYVRCLPPSLFAQTRHGAAAHTAGIVVYNGPTPASRDNEWMEAAAKAEAAAAAARTYWA